LQKIAGGREAEMFAWGDGRVLRLFFPGRPSSEAERHAHLLERLSVAGLRVPAVFGLETVDGRHGIVMERLDGADLLTELGRKPWRLFAGASTCGRVHAKLNSTPAPDGLPSVHDRLARFILRPERVPPELAELAVERLRGLPRGDRLLHGDYHPANVMTQRGEPVVIDWSNASAGPPEADFACTCMLLSLGEPPHSISLLTRLMARVGRSVFGVLYSRAYRRELRLDERLLEAWRLPVAIARLADSIPEEQEKLHRLIAGLRRQA
jgi:aminoglycoside phosphotransferase (APT) family kinase protein